MSPTSPDLAPYRPLTIVDRDPYELLDRAWLEVATRFPGIIRRPFTLEDALLAAGALLTGEQVMRLNLIPDNTAQMVAAMLTVPRETGARPTSRLTVTVIDAGGHNIPAGTRFRLEAGTSTGEPVDFTLDEDLVLDVGQTVGTVDITGTTVTAAANGVAAGTALDPAESIYIVEAAALADPVAGGADVETTLEWLTRARARFARSTDTLQSARSFLLATPELAPAAYRVLVLNKYDPGGAGVVGGDPGHITVAVLGVDGDALSAGERDALEAALQDIASAELVVHVIDATVTVVGVEVTVVRLPGYTDADVKASVVAAVRGYLNTNTWGVDAGAWGGTVYRNELISVIDQAAGVDRVVTLTAPAADAALAGAAPLAATDITVDDVAVLAA